jgi:hypothetical protein
MASTSLKNSPANYSLETRQNEAVFGNRIHAMRAYASENAFPDAGIFAGPMPADALSHNPTDIESQLRGIGASDLTRQRPVHAPAPVKRGTVAFFDRMPFVVPDPLVVRTGQRPIIP